MLTTAPYRRLSDLDEVKTDSLLKLITLANADTRPEKIDVGVGVYRDGDGNTPILRAVKAAEKRLWESQETKSYLGMRGNKRLAEQLGEIVFGTMPADGTIDGVHTPGGCGALTLVFALIAATNPDTRVFVGTPTWPNHVPIIEGAGLKIQTYDYYDRDGRRILFDSMMAALREAEPGDAVLLHGCCHNPTGADLDQAQWDEVAALCAERGLLPVVDIAYQGLGDGFDEDASGLRKVVAACEEVLVAQSCDKNFGVYRDRVGCFFVKTGSGDATARAMGHVMQLARKVWSMPPDHAASAISIVLDDPELRADWLSEVGDMRARVHRVRNKVAAADERLAFIANQKGMFSMLPVSQEQVDRLREDHAVYMADSGRFNVLGMSDEAIDRFTTAVLGVMDD